MRYRHSADDEIGVLTLSLVGTVLIFGLFIIGLTTIALIAVPTVAIYVGYRIVFIFLNTEKRQERKARAHTQMLYDAALAARAGIPDRMEWGKQLYRQFPELPEELDKALVIAALNIFDSEQFELPPIPPVCNSIEGARYRDLLAKVPKPQQAMAAVLECARDIAVRIPKPARSGLNFSVPLRDIADGEMVESIILNFYGDRNVGLFNTLRTQFDRNACEASGIPYPLEDDNGDKFVTPSNYVGNDVVYAYLKSTPFRALFDCSVPFSIPQELRYEHCVITAGTGHGKSTLLEMMLDQDLQTDMSVVLVDSQQQLISKIAQLKPLQDRNLIIIDPLDHPALNLFDINQERFAHYGPEQQQQVFNQTLEIFTYLLNSLIGADLTVRQGTLFTNLITLMLALPQTLGRNATLLDLMRYMEDPGPYAPAVASLDPIAREFFTRDLAKLPQYNQTKEQIRYRLQALLSTKSLAPLFLAPENRVDFFSELNRGAIILVDTNKAHLGKKNSAYLGRIAITLILKAIIERAAMRTDKHPIIFYIDEAGEYFDQSIDSFLTEARKQFTGITMAHQYLGQLTPELRSSVASNTSIKFAGGMSAADARSLAPDMRTTGDFLLEQPPYQFGCYAKGGTPCAVSIPVHPDAFARHEQLTLDEYEIFRKRNREKVCFRQPVQAETASSKPEENDETAKSGEW